MLAHCQIPIPSVQWMTAAVHVQPLRKRVFAGNDDVHIVTAAKTMIEHRQEAVRVGRQVHVHDIGFLIDHVIEKTRILVSEAVVILLPDVGRKQVVGRSDLPSPRQFPRHLQPLGVLAEHRIHDADKGFVAVEQAVTPGE